MYYILPTIYHILSTTMVVFDKFQEYFVKSWKVVRLNEETMDEISKDSKVLPYVIVMAVLPSLLQYGLISLAFRKFDWQDFVAQVVLMILSLSIIFVMAVLGRNIGKYKNIFATSVSYSTFIRPAFAANVVAWLLLIPFVLFLMGVPLEGFLHAMAFVTAVWTIVVYYRLLKFFYRLTFFKAFLTIILSLIVITAVTGFVVDSLVKLGLQSEVLTQLLQRATS